jgi:hypothetical protein
MLLIVIVVFLFLLVLSCVVSYTAGRAKGFEECYKQYVDFYWDDQAIKNQTSSKASES